MPADDLAGKRPIRPSGAPPRPGSVPDDETIVRPRPISMPRRILRDEPVVSEPMSPASASASAVSAAPASATVSPRASRPVTAPVRAQSPRLPARAASTVLTHRTIGGSPGHLDLTAARQTGGASPGVLLEAAPDALPELLEEAPPRRLTRQPAFIVSMAAATVVIVVVVILVLMQTVFRGPDRVEGLQLLDGGDNYVLQWSGPDVPYSVVMTGGPTGKADDISSLIKGGREAWIPKSNAGATDRSCFVVRSQRAAADDKMPTTRSALAAQGAGRICVADIKAR